MVRGTNDPRYGLHNIGGSINFGTRQGGNYSDGRVTLGSHATREVAPGRESEGLRKLLHRPPRSDGHRAHSDTENTHWAASGFDLGGRQDQGRSRGAPVFAQG